MVTGNQIRIARFALRWSVQRLSEETGVPLRTVKRVEAEDRIPSTSASTVHTLQSALESAGIEFIGTPDDAPGVRIHTPKD
jgi:transcriptional regulator with XRE-family HTH domain|tara:strand:- start:2110 stop:2352 length:243 start_codon:yes stop_codon:yes gene_type:complete